MDTDVALSEAVRRSEDENVVTQMYRHIVARVRIHGANPPLTHRLHSAVFDKARVQLY
jgi:hypothetical protein